MPPGPDPGGWWALSLDVSDDRTEGAVRSVASPEASRSFAPLVRKEWDEFLSLLRRPDLDGGPLGLGGVADGELRGRSVGLIVSCGRCSVREFQVTPLPPGGEF